MGAPSFRAERKGGKSRRLIQDRELDLVHLPGDHRQEEKALQAALRQLWVIDNASNKSDVP